MSRRMYLVVFLSCLVSLSYERERRTLAQVPEAPSFTQGQSIADAVLRDMNAQGIGTLAEAKSGYLIAEGDSWFSYPGLDVLAALAGNKLPGVRYRVYSAASAGDTVESMAYDAQQLEGFASEFRKVADAGKAGEVKAILLSGGGNDIAGSEFHMLLNHSQSSAGVTSPLDIAMSDALIERIARDVVSLIGTARRFAEVYLGRRDIPILIHGYARPVPDGRPFLIGWPLPGPWLQPGFAAKGFVRDDPGDLQRNTRVMADLITKFNNRIEKIPGELQGAADVRYVNVVAAANNEVAGGAYRQDWANELHPRDAAFIRVAGEFQKKILAP